MTVSFDPTALPSELFINGAWRAAITGTTFPVENPATNVVIAQVADGGPDDAAQAIHAAGRAQWAKSTPRVRADILYRAYELVVAKTDRLAAIMTAEMGKPLAEARGEVALLR
jgi:succinate-semialdehyde dehydrogenase/glutarate-semialdehyde dehydrogenase